jgi:hypothetical protein
MIATIILLIAFVALIYIFMQQAQFGKRPSGNRLELIKKSPNYRNGSFQNLSHTPDLTEGASFFSVMKEFLFKGNKLKKPNQKIPTVKTDLLYLNRQKM